MYRIKKGKSESLDYIKSNHIKGVVRPNFDDQGKLIGYLNGSIVPRINRAIKILEEDNNKGATFFRKLKDEKFKLLNRILGGKPHELQKIITEINQDIRKKKYPAIVFKKGEKNFHYYLSYVFNYKDFIVKSKIKDEYDAYALADLLGVNVCPYCNRNYTITVIKDMDKTVRPEFDHFFYQKRYPYLGLSFYNLIPSCHICNSNIKGDDDFNTKDFIHPYLHSFDDHYKFITDLGQKKVNRMGIFYSQTDSFNLKLVAKSKKRSADNKRSANHVKTFSLNKIYDYHKDLVVEMIHSAIIYDQNRINELYTNFGGKLFASPGEVKRFVMRNYYSEEDLHLRPFSKLAKDIHKEFGIN